MRALQFAVLALRAWAEQPPLFLVPGLTGSALDARLHDAVMPHWECDSDTHGGWINIWVKFGSVLPREKDCLIARMTLTYDSGTDSYSNLPGVDIRTNSQMGLLYKYEFGSMIDKLEKSLGYTLGANMFITPFDWRLAGDSHARVTNGVGGFYQQLQTMIEKAVNTTGQRSVVLSHSLGCPTILYFFHKYVSEAWRAEYIHGWVAISGPWLGSTMQASAYLGGWDLDLPGWLVPHDYVKPVQVNASSGVWLSPNEMAFGDVPIVTTPSKNYTAKDLHHLISIIGDQAGGQQALSLQKKLSGDLPSLQKPPVSVPMLNWYSTGVKTSERYEFRSEITSGFNQAPDVVHYGDGDGIVNHVSATSVERLWPNDKSAPVATKVFPGASHFGMLSDGRVLKALVDYLNTTKTPPPAVARLMDIVV